MKVLRQVCVMALLVVPSTPVFAQGAEPAPFKLIRTLQHAQDQIAKGSQVAYDVQRKLLDHIGTKFIKFPDHVWADAKNSEAAAVFALAGGDPQVGKWLLNNRTLAAEYKDILQGAVAFASRKYPEAAKVLAPFKPLKYPGHLGGSLALVKAMLVAKEDPKAAAKLFAISRLLVPGTLIEESALRRSLVLFKKKEDLPQLVTTSSLYYRQFGQSVFGPVFDDRLATAVVEFDDDALGEIQEELSKVVKLTSENRQKKIFLMFAKKAVLNGKMAFARFTSSNAATIDENDAQTVARAHLYMAAADVVSETPEKGLNALGEIDSKILSDDDKSIMKNASKVGSAIAQWPPAAPTKEQSEEMATSDKEAFSDDLFKRIEPLMVEVNGILESLDQ